MNISEFKPVIDIESFKPLLKTSGPQASNNQTFTIAAHRMGLSTSFKAHHPSYKSVEIRINKRQILLIFGTESKELDSKTWSVYSTGAGYSFGSINIVDQIRKASHTLNKDNRYRFDIEPVGNDMYLVNIDRPVQVYKAIKGHKYKKSRSDFFERR